MRAGDNMQQYDSLVNKLKLLLQIEKNTRTQLRFVRRHEMRGLQRLLRERAKLIHQLTMLNAEISAFPEEPATEEANILCRQIREREQAILVYNEATVQTAKAERDNLAESLKKIRQYRHLREGYRPKGGYAGGGCFNKKV